MNFFEDTYNTNNTDNIDTYNKPKIIDIYFYNHIIPGIFAYILFHKILKYSLQKSFIVWIIIHTLYEIKDYYYTYIKKYDIRPNRVNKLNGFFHSDNSFINSIGDTIAAIIGFYMLYYIRNPFAHLILIVLFVVYIIYMSNTHWIDDFAYLKTLL